MRPRPSLVFVLVVVLLTAGLVGVTRWSPGPLRVGMVAAGAVGGTVPVSSTTLVCPDASAPGDASATDVTLVAPVIATTSSATVTPPTDSRAVAQPLDTLLDTGPTVTGSQDSAAAIASLAEQGLASTATVTDTDAGPVVVRTVGTLAPGLSAVQVTTVGGGDATGLAAAACVEPSSESWLLGVGTEIGHRPRLSIVNVEPTAIEVDVVLYGTEGPVDVPSLIGVVVPLRGEVTVELESVAPDLAELAVHVQPRTGRVVAAVRDSRVQGLSSLGVDWVPAAAAPSTRVVVPGVSGGGGQRLLHLLAPGDLDTRVGVRLLTTTGPIVPAGLEEIELTAGVVASLDLATVLGSEVAAVELTATEPVVAGLRVTTSATGAAEMAYTAGSTPLSGLAVAPDVRTDEGWTGRLVLSADDRGPLGEELSPAASAVPARVRVDYFDAGSGELVRSDEVEVSGGSTLEVPLDPAGTDGGATSPRASVVVTSLGGPSQRLVYGTLQLDRSGGPDAGFTIVPLLSPRLVVDVPAVRHDLSTGLRAE